MSFHRLNFPRTAFLLLENQMRFLLIISCGVAAFLVFSGCAQRTTSSSVHEREVSVAPEPDMEAAKLGFPDKFVSHKSKTINWDKVPQTKVNGLPAQVVNGFVVDLCGGNCDK